MESNSILDRVISSKKMTAIEQFNPTEVVSSLLKSLASREEDVLRRRYGLMGKKKETLEEIGETYKVTRERIRQIEKTAVKKIKQLKSFTEQTRSIENTIFNVLEQHGAIMSEDSLLEELFQVVGDNSINRQNIIFIIDELLSSKFKSFGPTEDFKKSWQIIHASTRILKDTVDVFIGEIEKNTKPVSLNDALNIFKNTELYQRNQTQLNDDTITAYLDVSAKIAKNPFGEYGLVEWGSIVPKRMNDKIYLILKRHGKPMHFTDIADKINDTKFDKRKAYAPTVHNELILNDRYILVGRGIYALKEWGYKSGVVANVLKEILLQEDRPMTREELVGKVLEQRIVKKNTIHLALTDKSKFKKNQDDLYSINDSQEGNV